MAIDWDEVFRKAEEARKAVEQGKSPLAGEHPENGPPEGRKPSGGASNPLRRGGFEMTGHEPPNPGSVEPPAEIRQASNALWGMYKAFTDAGFSPAQAMQLIVAQIQAMGGK